MGFYDNGWLNSTNITNVSELFNSYSPPSGSAGSFHCFSAYFFPKLLTPTRAFTYADVSNWFTSDPRRNPLLCDFLYIPINLTESHWTGMIVDTHKHHLTYYDSLGDYRGECSRALYYTREWLSAELQNQTHLGNISAERATSLGMVCNWTYTHNPGPSPTQTNGFDCGVFYLATILYHIQGRAPNFYQSHLPTIRLQLTIGLLTHSIPSPHIPLSHFDYPLSYVHTTSRNVTYLRQLIPPRLSQSLRSSHTSPRVLITLDSKDATSFTLPQNDPVSEEQSRDVSSTHSHHLTPIPHALTHPP